MEHYHKESFGNSSINIIEKFWSELHGDCKEKREFFIKNIDKPRKELPHQLHRIYDKIKKSEFIVEIGF